jgi:hypothetical protein
MSMNDPSSSSGGGGAGGWLERNPTIALGGAVVGVLIVGGYMLSKKAGGATIGGTNPSGATQDLSGLTNGVVYVPTSTSFTTENSTDASQTVSNTGAGNVTTGSSSAGNVIPPTSGTKTPASNPGKIMKLPVPTPPKVSMQWTQTYITANQSLNGVAKNATIAMAGDASKYKATQKFTVTGQQIDNQNSGAVNAYWLAHKLGSKSKLTTTTTGMSIKIPHLVLG